MLADSFQQKLYSPEGMKLLVIDGRFVDAPDYHPSLCEVVLHKELESLNEELESLELLSVYPSDCIQIGDNAGNPKDVSFVYFPIIPMKFRNHSMTSHSSLCGSSRSSEEILLVTWFDGLIRGVSEVTERFDAMWMRDWVWRNAMWMGNGPWERDTNGMMNETDLM